MVKEGVSSLKELEDRMEEKKELLGGAETLEEVLSAYVRVFPYLEEAERRAELRMIAENAMVQAIGMEGEFLILRTHRIMVKAPAPGKTKCGNSGCTLIQCQQYERMEMRQFDLGRWKVRIDLRAPYDIKVFPEDGQKRIGYALHPHVYNAAADGGDAVREYRICWGNLYSDAENAAPLRRIGLLAEMVFLVLTKINTNDLESVRAFYDIGKEIPKEAADVRQEKKAVKKIVRSGRRAHESRQG